MDAVKIIVKIEKLKKKKVDTAKIFGKKHGARIYGIIINGAFLANTL